jgi:hypothetical protein
MPANPIPAPPGSAKPNPGSAGKLSHTWLGWSFVSALIADGKEYLLDQALLDELTHGVVPDGR